MRGPIATLTYRISDFISNSMGSRRSDSPLGLASRVASLCWVLVIGLLVMQARVQASYWHDREKLWRYEVAIAPDNFVARVNLGLVLDAKGQIDADHGV